METIVLSEKIENLANDSFKSIDDIQKRIAKATKTSPKKLFKGHKTFKDYCMALANQLMKPSCKDVLTYVRTEVLK